jgi:hypothetical protein
VNGGVGGGPAADARPVGARLVGEREVGIQREAGGDAAAAGAPPQLHDANELRRRRHLFAAGVIKPGQELGAGDHAGPADASPSLSLR